MEDTSPLHIRQLTVNYGNRPALWDISLKIPQGGNLVAILGPNGAGKSTLLKASLGLIRPHLGSVHFFGGSLKKTRGRISYIPQKESVDWDFPITVFDLVLMGRYGHLGPFRFPQKKDRDIANHYLSLLGLEGYKNRQISQLSGGQQQRAFMARALCQEADLYLMDEPFSGVDISSKEMIIKILKSLRDQGKTLMVVHHELDSVPHIFDMVVLLNMRLVAAGSVREMFTQELIWQTFGKDPALFEEAMKRKEMKRQGAS
jgi:manganese/zinc/iron transport system ATP- binding protein